MKFYIDPTLLYGMGFLSKETNRKRNVYSYKAKNSKLLVENILMDYINILDNYFEHYKQHVDEPNDGKDYDIFKRVYLEVFSKFEHYSKLMLSSLYMAITTKYNEILEEVKTVVWYNIQTVNFNDILHKAFVRFTYYTLNNLVNAGILKLDIDGICLTDFFFNYIYFHGGLYGKKKYLEEAIVEITTDENNIPAEVISEADEVVVEEVTENDYVKELQEEVRNILNHYLSCSNKNKITIVHLREHTSTDKKDITELYFVTE